MKTHWAAPAIIAAVAALLVGAPAASSDVSSPLTNAKHFFWAQGADPQGTANSLQNDIIFHGGNAGPGAIGVETKPAVYLVYWGTEWSTGFTTADTDGKAYSSKTLQNYLDTFVANVGGSPWAAVKAVSKALPHGSDPTPIQAAGASYGCPSTFSGPAGDASSLPGSAPQLDILHGDVALSSDGTKVRAVLTVANLSPSAPTGWTGADWIMYWTQPDDGTVPPATYTHDYYAVAATVDALGNVTYTDGTIAFDDSGDSQYTPVNTVTGTYTTGPNGSIEIDAPLGDVGLASGTQMGTVGGATDEGNPMTGLIVDTAAGSGSWTLGTTSCLG